MKIEYFGSIIAKDLYDGTWALVQGAEDGFQCLIDRKIIVRPPNGRITDFASVPQLFWSVLPKSSEKYDPAAIIHDEMYYCGFDRKYADEVFLAGMETLDIGRVKRYAIYYAVRAFGWKAYNDHRKAGHGKTL